ncbi:EamA family transporter [Aeromicrobium massiliense]|uniref:EamA family transporter n=1 Tax=Aeromicrobium massiliense TaxID=1464554 RepID=UPI000578AF51|nr:EamA family transporter [Aeromicrobium massiliense]
MSTRDKVLAVMVASVWGLNFVAIEASLQHFPPYFLIVLRFVLLAVPTILFVPFPDVPLRWLVGGALSFGVVQFVFLYAALLAGLPAGLASLVLQAAAPMTVLMGTVWLKERVTAWQGVGVALAVAGLVIIATARASSASVLPLVLGLLAAAGWAVSNICSSLAAPDHPVRYTMWMSVVPPIPMLAVSLVVEGPAEIGASLTSAFTADAAPAVLGLLYTVLMGSVIGAGAWTALLKRNPSSRVAPYSMLVPVTGFAGAWVLLGETPHVGDLVGGAVVIAGLLVAGLAVGSGRARQDVPASGLVPTPPVPQQPPS